LEEEQREFKEAQAGNVELSQQTAQLQKRVEELKFEFQDIQSEAEREDRLLSSREQNRDKEIAGKKALIRLYEDIMGIRIEPVSRESIKLILTKVDQSQPLLPFSITIDHSGDRYSVKECSPVIPDMPSLVAALNQTHDFCQFVCRARRRFQELCGGQK
jgi:hypothetical protein